MYTSECCGALPLYDIHEFEDEWYGLCGDCAEQTDFKYEELKQWNTSKNQK